MLHQGAGHSELLLRGVAGVVGVVEARPLHLAQAVGVGAVLLPPASPAEAHVPFSVMELLQEEFTAAATHHSS
jgi:hypothetical protein